MPDKVQSIPGADPQIEEIVKDTVSATKGGTHYGSETFNGAVTFAGALTIQNLVNLAIDLILKKANPALRLIGTEGSAKDFRIVEDAGAVKIQVNTGSEGSPSWSTVFSVDSTGITAGEKDPAAAALVEGETILTSGDVTTTSTSYVDLTGLTVTKTTGARRCLVSCNLTVLRPAGQSVLVTLNIDGTNYPSSGGIGSSVGANADTISVNFSFVTPVLSAGSHTFKVQWKVSGGTGTARANGAVPAALQVIELPHTT